METPGKETATLKILIATDGSDFSRRAVEECCRIVIKDRKTEVKIISVFDNVYQMATEPFSVSAEYIQEMENAARAQSEKYASDAAKLIRKCLPESDVQMTTKIERGSPERTIIEEAEEWKADLIVLGSHGRGFWGRMFLGSVSSAVINQAACSVLIVRGR